MAEGPFKDNETGVRNPALHLYFIIHYQVHSNNIKLRTELSRYKRINKTCKYKIWNSQFKFYFNLMNLLFKSCRTSDPNRASAGCRKDITISAPLRFCCSSLRRSSSFGLG